MKPIQVLLAVFFCCSVGFAQTPVTESNIKYNQQTYIMYGRPEIIKVDRGGTRLDPSNTVISDLNMTFKILNTFEEGGVTYCQIQVVEYASDIKKLIFNVYSSAVGNMEYTTLKNETKDKIKTYIEQSTQKVYFLITKEDLLKYGFVYDPTPLTEFTFGTVTYLTRIRPGIDGGRMRWSNDLSLGLAAGVKINATKNSAFSLLGGLSISKVSLDELSTRGKATQVIEKPALTPNLNIMYSYKIFSLGLGFGWDLINEDTEESKAWVYNGKLFYGLCFGINIFQNHGEGSTTTAAQDNE